MSILNRHPGSFWCIRKTGSHFLGQRPVSHPSFLPSSSGLHQHGLAETRDPRMEVLGSTTFLGLNSPKLKSPRKGRGTRDQISNICWIMEKAREFQKNIYFCFVDYAKAFDCVDHKKLWKILQEMGIPDHLTCLLRNLYTGQETTVRPGHGTRDWFQIGKGVRQGCILSLCLFNLHAEYILC